MITWHQGHIGFFHDELGSAFRAHQLDRSDGRADENQAAVLTLLRKLRILGEKAIPRMNGLRPTFQGDVNNAVAVEVAGFWSGGSQVPGLVRFPNESGVAIRTGMDADAADSHTSGGAHDAARNFTAVGD